LEIVMNDEAPDRCFSIEEMDGILGLDPTHPRRRHLESCPRCSARLLVYKEFIEDLSPAPGSDTRDAAVRLRQAFDEELGRRQMREGTEARPTSSWTGRFWWLRPRTIQPAWALAAVLFVAGALYAGSHYRSTRGDSDLLRSTPPSGAVSDRGTVELMAPRIGPGGEIEMRWHAVPNADAYRVRLVGADLADLAHFEPIPDTRLSLRRDQIPRSLSAGDVIGWEVVAMRAGQEIARSPVSTIRIP
jgi:hypothetical protein